MARIAQAETRELIAALQPNCLAWLRARHRRCMHSGLGDKYAPIPRVFPCGKSCWECTWVGGRSLSAPPCWSTTSWKRATAASRSSSSTDREVVWKRSKRDRASPHARACTGHRSGHDAGLCRRTGKEHAHLWTTISQASAQGGRSRGRWSSRRLRGEGLHHSRNDHRDAAAIGELMEVAALAVQSLASYGNRVRQGVHE